MRIRNKQLYKIFLESQPSNKYQRYQNINFFLNNASEYLKSIIKNLLIFVQEDSVESILNIFRILCKKNIIYNPYVAGKFLKIIFLKIYDLYITG